MPLKATPLFSSPKRKPLIEQQIAALGLPDPVTELQFAKAAIGRRWAFDYAWPQQRIAFEVEGGAFIGGRHTSGAGFQGDCEKYSWASILGWIVIRSTPRMIRDGLAITLLQEAFKRTSWQPERT